MKKMIILEENFKWHLEAFASELFICSVGCIVSQLLCSVKKLKQKVLLDQCCLHLAKWSI